MQSLQVLGVHTTPRTARLMQRLLRALGMRGRLVGSGREALEHYPRASYGLVLMESQLHDMTGAELVAALRRLQERSGWQPILLLCRSSREEERLAAFAAGCDEAIGRPLKLRLLVARIASLRRTAQMQERIALQHQQLLDYRHKELEEKRISNFLVHRLTRHDLLAREPLDYLLEPADGVSGDLLLACRSRNGELYVMLADASGHGLPAALTLIPLSQTFYAMAVKGFSLDSIARTLNRKNREYSPADRFVAALLARYSPLEGSLSVWNGGIPAALLMDREGRIIRRFRSLNLPLGIVGDEAFSCESEIHALQAPGQLLFFSDGLIEAESPDGEPFGQARLENVLRTSPPEQRIARLKAQVSAHRQGRPAHDDVSCLQLYCLPASLPPPVPDEHARCAERWGLQLQLTARQLREQQDLEPLISAFCQGLGLEASRHGVFSLVLRELLSNAIDHGLLQLESAIKNQPDGFERYVQRRQEALQRLDSGEVRLDIRQNSERGENRLSLQVSDSGRGFDHRALETQGTLAWHGRGLLLVRRLCSRLSFNDSGNVVTAELTWRPEAAEPSP